MRTKVLGVIMAVLAFITQVAGAQGVAEVKPDQQVFNFGTIEEAKGLASHVFKIENTGTAPLVITRITASCGCTRPEWSKEPVAPGASVDVKVTYNPKGRPGPFYKTITIYSNAKKRRYNLAIKGNVKPKPKEPVYNYIYAIGDVKFHTPDVLYSEIREDETLGRKVSVKNFGKGSATIRVGKHPDWLTVSMTPDTLLPGKTGELLFLLDASKLKKKGRTTRYIPLEIRTVGKEKVSGALHLAANCVDDYSRLTTEQVKKAPKARLSGTLLNFGTLEAGKKKVTGTVELTNAGQTELKVYSATSDDAFVRVSGGKKTVKPGQTVTYKLTLKAKEMPASVASLVTFVTNDPDEPVLMLKVAAKKGVEN